MALEASGTQTATVGTEHTLATLTTAKTFQLYVDLANLASGDVVELRVYLKVLSGGTSREAQYAVYSGVQGQPIVWSIPVMSDIEVKFTLYQTAGTGRSFPWKVLSP